MSVHLVGGGRTQAWTEAVYGGFAREAIARGEAAGRTTAEVGVVLVSDADEPDSGPENHRWFAEAAGAADRLRTRPILLTVGETVAAETLEGLDGLLVGGGLTPAYHEAFRPVAERVRGLVEEGMPYLGFSAGTSVAASEALVGGWLLGETPVCHPDNAEDLEQVTVLPGLGLLPGTVDVHLAQWGNLSRLVSAVEAGLADHGWGIDEDTVLIVSGATSTVRGAGRVWSVRRTATGVSVQTRSAAD